MGIRPSAETGSGDGNQLAVDQIGEVYANVKAVADNIDHVVVVSENTAALLAIDAPTIVNAAATATTKAGEAAASATAAATSANNADADRIAAQAAATTAVAARDAALLAETNAETAETNAETAQAAAAASQTAAATSATTATTQAGIATTKADEASASATAAANSATAASTSATNATNANTAAQAAKTAAELAETNAELAETNAEAAQAAAVVAQLAAEAARDEAEAIAGGDYVLATGDIMTGKLTTVASAAGGAGFNLGYGANPTTPVDGDIWLNTSDQVRYRAGGVTRTLAPTSGFTSSGHITVPADPYAVGWDGNLTVPTKNDVYDKIETLMPKTGGVFSVAPTLPANAYAVGWNGSLKPATEDAVYDEIEALKALVVGSVKYISTWNASTNTPAIPAAAAGNKGYYYKVATAGATSIDGITDWKIGDWIISTGTAWEKVDNTDQVSTVNGQSGAVVLNTSHITESGSLYFTTARVLATTLAGFSSASGGSIVAGDTVLAAFGKAQNSIDTLASALTTKFDKAGGTVDGNLSIGGTLTVSAGGTIAGSLAIGGGLTVPASITLTGAGAAPMQWNDGTYRGMIYMVAGGAVYRNDAKHLFRNGDGSVDWAEINATGIAVPGQVSVSGATAAVILGDQDLTGSLSLYNSGDVFRVYINGADRFTVTATGDVACNGVTATGTVVTPAITLNGTDLGTTLNNKAQAYTSILSQSTNFTAGSSHNNAHIVLSGASRTMTLNNTAPAGTSFTTRFTTAWSITCSSLSKNGATPAANGSVAAGKSVTFLHEGGGTWIAWGDIT